jgi:hypothetical protein
MGSHCSFERLKRKLWPKEGPGVELPGVELPGVCQFWLPTTKSRESTRNTWMQTTCDIPLESSRRELQLCFRSHFNPRFARKVMGLQSPRSPLGRDFGTPTRESRESRERKSHLDVGLVESHRVYYKGEGGASPEVRAVVSLVCPCCPWFVPAPKVLQLCTNHFVWVVCKPVWVNKLVNSS